MQETRLLTFYHWTRTRTSTVQCSSYDTLISTLIFLSVVVVPVPALVLADVVVVIVVPSVVAAATVAASVVAARGRTAAAREVNGVDDRAAADLKASSHPAALHRLSNAAVPYSVA